MKSRISFLAFFIIPAALLAQNQPHRALAPAPANPAAHASAAQGASAATPPPANAPKITCLHPNFDFGNVDEGPDIVHIFHFRNSGKSTLKITNVGTSCGCTAAVVEENGIEKKPSDTSPVEVPVGGRSTIKATYHTSGRIGHATKIITVTSNDPVNAQFKMQLDMTVVREVDVQPDRLYLYNIKHGTARDTEIKVMGKPGMKLNVLSAVSGSGVVSVSEIKPFYDEKEKKYGATFTVTLPATRPIGGVTDEITIKTDSPKKPEIKLQVLGEVVGRVQYNPKEFYFAAHSDAPATVTFTVDQPQGFAIHKVESAKHLVRPYLRTQTIGYGNGGQQYMIIAKPVKNLPEGSDGKDQVLVWTNDSEQPQISIDAQINK
jgi:hypothetical protein